jgi:hypothetical protein
MAGAWVFAGAHRLISNAIKETRAKAPSATADPPLTAQSETTAAAAGSRIFACERCGQKLRVPKMDVHMRVTCKTCQHQFWLSPEPGNGQER